LKINWILVWTVIAFTPATCQDILGDFTRSPTEHIINQIDDPFVVRSVRGSIVLNGGYEDALADVLFEIQGPGNDKKIRKGKTDKLGLFRIGNVPSGEYRFKTTLNGYRSEMGAITVSRKAPKKNIIRIALRVGV